MLLGGQGREEGGGGDQAALLHPARLPQCIMQPVQALAQVQADYIPEIISSQHIFLEDDQSLEVLLVQGTALQLHNLCDALRQIRGVQQTRLVTTTALLPPLSSKDPRG